MEEIEKFNKPTHTRKYVTELFSQCNLFCTLSRDINSGNGKMYTYRIRGFLYTRVDSFAPRKIMERIIEEYNFKHNNFDLNVIVDPSFVHGNVAYRRLLRVLSKLRS